MRVMMIIVMMIMVTVMQLQSINQQVNTEGINDQTAETFAFFVVVLTCAQSQKVSQAQRSSE